MNRRLATSFLMCCSAFKKKIFKFPSAKLSNIFQTAAVFEERSGILECLTFRKVMQKFYPRNTPTSKDVTALDAAAICIQWQRGRSSLKHKAVAQAVWNTKKLLTQHAVTMTTRQNHLA